MLRLPSTERWPWRAGFIADTRGAAHPRTLVIGGVLGLLTCIGLSMLAQSVDDQAKAAVEDLDTPAPLPTLKAGDDDPDAPAPLPTLQPRRSR